MESPHFCPFFREGGTREPDVPAFGLLRECCHGPWLFWSRFVRVIESLTPPAYRSVICGGPSKCVSVARTSVCQPRKWWHEIPSKAEELISRRGEFFHAHRVVMYLLGDDGSAFEFHLQRILFFKSVFLSARGRLNFSWTEEQVLQDARPFFFWTSKRPSFFAITQRLSVWQSFSLTLFLSDLLKSFVFWEKIRKKKRKARI